MALRSGRVGPARSGRIFIAARRLARPERYACRSLGRHAPLLVVRHCRLLKNKYLASAAPPRTTSTTISNPPNPMPNIDEPTSIIPFIINLHIPKGYSFVRSFYRMLAAPERFVRRSASGGTSAADALLISAARPPPRIPKMPSHEPALVRRLIFA